MSDATPPVPVPGATSGRVLRNNPLSGAMYFVRGLTLITRPGVRAYVVIPLVINVALFATLIYFGTSELIELTERELPKWLEFLRWILIPIFVLAALVAGFFMFNLVANLIASPFNGLLAEAVERELTGRAIPGGGGWRKMVAELGATLVAEARKLFYVAIRTVPLLLLLLIPVINVVASVLWLLLGAWMLAITFVDYPMANHGIMFSDQRRRLAERRYLALGFGGAVMAAIAVPVLNFIVIPCAVAGATAMWIEQLEDDD